MERTGQFNLDTQPTSRYEGGWVDNPADKGGETFRGIARRWHGTWPGWGVVDLMRHHPSFPSNVNNNDELKTMAADFYRANFWNPVHGEELPWRMAAVVYDMAVNSDVKPAIRQLQVALNVCGAGLVVDGEIGSRTVKACWDKGKDAVEEFLLARIMFYTDIMIKDPAQRVWARNWLRRIVEMADYALEG